jgi:hypothetical protein
MSASALNLKMCNQAKAARIALIAMTLWLPTLFAPSAHADIRVLGVSKTRQTPQIKINLYGRPFAGALVEVYRGFGPHFEPPKTKPLLVLTSDASGNVVIPKLPRGRYYILGRAKPDREGDLYLEISLFGRKWPDLILNLNPTPGSAEDVLAYVGSFKHAKLVSAFHGVVKRFPDGTLLPNANIYVFVRDKNIDQQPIRLLTNSAGEFSADLPEGQYILHIWKDNCESIVSVDVSKAATSETLQIQLYPIQS